MNVDQILNFCEFIEQSGNKLKLLSQPERMLCKKVALLVSEHPSGPFSLAPIEEKQLEEIHLKIASTTAYQPERSPWDFIASFFKGIGNRLHLRISSYELSETLSEMKRAQIAAKTLTPEEIEEKFRDFHGDRREIVQLLDLLREESKEEKVALIRPLASLLVQTRPGGNEKVFEVIAQIPPKMRGKVAREALLAIDRFRAVQTTHFQRQYEEERLFTIVLQFPPEQRAAGFEQLLALLTIEERTGSRSDGLWRIYQMPIDQRLDVLNKALPLISDGSQVSFLNCVGAISQEHRAAIVQAVKPLLEQAQFTGLKEGILQDVGKIDPKVAVEVLGKATAPLEGISDPRERVKFAEIALKLPPEQQSEVTKELISHFAPIELSWLRLERLEAMKKIPPDRLQGTILFANRSLADIPKNDRLYLFPTIAEIAPEEREDVFARARPFYKSLTDFARWPHIITTLAQIKRAEREEVINLAHPFLEDITDLRETNALLKSIALIPADSRALFMRTAETLFPKGSKADWRWEVQETLQLIPKAEMASVIHNCIPLIQNFAGRTILNILNTLRRSSPEQRELLSREVPPLFEGIEEVSDRANLLDTVTSISPFQRAAVIGLARPFLQRYRPYQRSLILMTLSLIPERHREAATREAAPIEEFEQFIRTLQRHIPRETGGHPYLIRIEGENGVKNNPLGLLHTLAEGFSQSVQTQLTAHYEGQWGIDMGGVGRQFISELFENLVKALCCKEMGKSQLYRPYLQLKNNQFVFSADQKRAYNELGRLMMFCLNATVEYPTGILLDEGVFTAITMFDDTLLEKEFDQLDLKNPEIFNRLLAIFEEMNRHIDSEMKQVNDIKRGFMQNELPYAFAIVEDEDSIQALKIAPAQLEANREQIYTALRNLLVQNILRPALAPLQEIARGMREAPFERNISFNTVRETLPRLLSDSLQGTTSRQAILEKLDFSSLIPPEKQKWLSKWVEETSEEKIRSFLFAITGSSALGKARIKINSTGREANIFFHTCFNMVDFPFDNIANEKEFTSILEGSLAGAKYNRA